MFERVMFFIDGENLVFRYQKMLEKGYEPLNAGIHKKDVYVWHSDIIRNIPRDIVRVTYYTSAVGDENEILSLSKEIKRIKYNYTGPRYGVGGGRYGGGSRSEQYTGNIFPRVFKKDNRSAKSKAVDINIAVDMLNYASLENLDAVYLLSGDGDFIPLIQAVMRKGTRVHLMALSDGLNPQLPIAVDEFECIDDKLFAKKQ